MHVFFCFKNPAAPTVAGKLKSEHYYRFPYRLWNRNLHKKVGLENGLSLCLKAAFSLNKIFLPSTSIYRVVEKIRSCSVSIKVYFKSQTEIIKRNPFQESSRSKPKMSLCTIQYYSSSDIYQHLSLKHSPQQLCSLFWLEIRVAWVGLQGVIHLNDRCLCWSATLTAFVLIVKGYTFWNNLGYLKTKQVISFWHIL